MELRGRLRVRALLALATVAQLITISFGVYSLLQPAATSAAQTVPYKINFQGRLTDNSGNVLTDGLYNIKFRLWDASTSGTNVWEADRVRGASDRRVQVTNGLFNIQFGDTTLGDPALSPTLFSNGTYPLYLEVELPTPATATCATNGCASFTEGAMTPRQALASAPYAFSADTLDGLDSAAFGQLAASNTFTGANVFQPSSGVAITVRPPAATHSLDVKDSSGTTQAYFDASGILNVGQTIQATAGTVDLGTSGATFRTGYFGTSVQTPALNASTSGGTVTTNLGTLQRTSSGTTTIDLKDAGTTTLAVTNSGGGVAGISASGGLTIGTGKVITVGATAGAAVSCSSGQVLDAVVVTGGVVTGGTCIAAGGGEKLGATWTSQSAGATTNTQTTINFTGGANSAPSFNNGTHVLTLPSNTSKLVITSKAGGGGGGGTGTAAVANKMASGGGEGGSSQYTLTGSLASNYYFKVGGGGGGGNTTPTAGTGGSNTCFGTNSGDACTTPVANATGGTGGTSSNVVCALVATVTGGSGTGDLVFTGAPALQNACTTATGVTLFSSAGGGAGGGKQLIAALAANGTANAGTAASGGGGGGSWTASGNGGNGGAGGSGYIAINVYLAITGTGNSATLQTAYDNSTDPEITLSSSGLSVRDSSGGLGANLFEVQDNTGSTNYLAVSATGVSTSGTLTANTTNTLNGLSVNAGALSGVNGYTQGSGTFVQTYSAATASSAHSIAVTNTNSGAGVTMQGINLTPTNATTPSSGTNTLNLLNFAAGTTGTGTLTNGINFASATGYTNYIQTPSFDLNSSGDITTGFTALNGTSTANGAGTASTTLVLTSATNFDVGNYVQVNSANCGGTGVNPCYAKITNIATNTLTITPALTWANGSTVNEYHVPEIGGIDTTQALANRFGRGYFISGVAAGNGTTYYNENSIETNLSSFDLLNTNVTTLNIGGAATSLSIGSGGTTVTIPGSLNVTGNITAPSTGTAGYLTRSGTVLSPVTAGDTFTTTGAINGGTITGTSLATSGNGALNLGSGTITSGAVNGQTIGNAASFVTSVTAPTINASTTLQVGGANINTGGGTPTLSNVDYLDAAQTLTATKTFSKSGGQAAIYSGTAASAGAIIQFGSVAGLSSGSVNGTYLGSNAATFTGDFINFQINNAVKLKVDNTGAATLAAGLTIGSGTVITVGASAGQTSTVSCSANQAVTTATFTGGVLTSAPGCATIAGTGATTTLNNVGSTSIGAALVSSANNTQNIGSAANVWQNVFTGNLDAGTTTTALTIGTASTTTAVTIGRSTVAVSVPGGISTSGGAINTGTGGITSTGTIAGNLFSGSGASLTSLNPTNLAQGSGAVTLQSANGTALTLNSGTTGALNLATQGSAKTIQIGQNTAAVTDVINIGNSAFVGSVDTITIGNQLTTSTTAIQGGTGTSAITLTPGTNGSVLASTTGTGTIEFNTATSVIVQSTTDSTKTFQIQNAATSPIFNVDTTDANIVATSGFEPNPLTNWNGLSGGTVARDITQHYVGFASGKVTAGTTAGGGVSQNLSLTPSTQYTLSFYAKLDAASAAFTTLQAGYSNTGLVAGEVDCPLNTTNVVTGGWNRYICTFTTPGSNSGTPYIYIEHSDTTSEVFYLDAVQIDAGSFATPYGSGQISLNANINSPVNFQQSSNSSTAFQITNTSGTNILNVDTLNNNLNNQATNPSLESGTTGWAAKTGCTLTQDATAAYNGTSSAKCVTTATANAGMNMTGISPVMVNGTTYTMAMYVKASANMTTLEIGRADNGSTDTACLTAQTVTSSGWKRFTCTFTAGTQSGTPYIYVKQTDATARTIWVDAVTFETDANASTNYRDGRISLGNATISSPAVFQTSTNSTTAFQIQNAAGIQVFNVDTASDLNLVTNAGFEVNTVGWSAINGATGLVRDTSKTYVGIASGKVTTAVTANSGLRYTFSAALPAVASTAYTISAYVQTSAADATFGMGYNSGSDVACTITPAASATVPSTSGWTRFTCSTPVNTAVNSIFITSGTTAITTLSVDGVRVELGSTASAYGASNISFNGVFTSPVAIRSPNDTTTEFQVQNSASLSLFSIDSLNKTIAVGGGTSDQNQVLLQLDSYEAASNSTADTATCSATVNVGALYYNTESNAIRACVNASWEDVMTTAGMGILAFGVVADTGLNPGDVASTTTTSTAVLGPCRVSWASATTVTVQPCVAYSGGRKVIVTGDATRQTMTTQTVTIPTGTANAFTHICLNTANTFQPNATAINATESANLPFSITSPVLCLADVKLTAAGTAIAAVYDVRTFTNSTKEFVNTAAATPLGVVVVPSGTGVALPGGAGVTSRGIIVASNGAAAVNGVPNAIIATQGPAYAKSTAGTTGAIVQTTGATGYVNTATLSANGYGNVGIARNTFPVTACTTTANAVNCSMSLFVNINLR